MCPYFSDVGRTQNCSSVPSDPVFRRAPNPNVKRATVDSFDVDIQLFSDQSLRPVPEITSCKADHRTKLVEATVWPVTLFRKLNGRKPDAYSGSVLVLSFVIGWRSASTVTFSLPV